jgi:hypothetical protein
LIVSALPFVAIETLLPAVITTSSFIELMLLTTAPGAILFAVTAPSTK